MSQRKFSVNDLDFNNIGGWPQAAKVVFSVLAGLLIVFLAWFALLKAKSENLADLEREEVNLRSEIEKQHGRAANMEPLKQQLVQMESVLSQMLRQLPSKTEMPDLIVDVSQTALSSGLSNELFQPGPESPMEFYAEKPIALRMAGSYHQFGDFVSRIASLPRVVTLTMHDISIKDGGTLLLTGTVKTYRYLDDEDVAAAEAVAVASREKEGS